MSAVRPALERVRDLLEQRFGLQVDETRRADLEKMLGVRAREARCASVSGYVGRLERDAEGELQSLAEMLTVGETYFFRQPEHFDVLWDRLGRRRAVRGGAEPIRLLSAGCATGEEPYTLAMTARARFGGPVTITAIDVNRSALRRAEEATYTDWSFRRTSV